MAISAPEEVIYQAKSLVTAFILDDEEVVNTVMAGHPDPLLAMALASMVASAVKALARNHDIDPVELWTRTMAVLAWEA